MTSFHPSEATFGCPNAGETMSSTGATVTIRRCDLCCHGQQTVSKSMHRNKDTTVAIARKVLEARSPGSKARRQAIKKHVRRTIRTPNEKTPLKSETTAQSTIVELKRPQPKSASLNSLTVDPMKAEFTLKGGMSS
uniref:60S ribosomal protein L28 n=1 Tax=Parascaris equorum TaxID=6256 RepID=A0A914RUK1_PAREQ